jgi:hypothetical protein
MVLILQSIFKNPRLASAGVLLTLSLCTGARAEILSEEDAATADTGALRQEIDLFTTIQRGVLLSVVECELVETCTAGVNKSEVEQIISMLDTRINSLSVRYTDTEDPALETVLLGYVDVRDSYNAILEKMDALPVFDVTEEAVVDEFGGDAFYGGVNSTGTGGVSQELFRLFQDADDELSDDDIPAEEAAP